MEGGSAFQRTVVNAASAPTSRDVGSAKLRTVNVIYVAQNCAFGAFKYHP